ncbi:YitT family protein [Sphingomonas sp. ID0503]|uniref:YitT family protein n=1 Tax=Sphingomonas sp. ID0503 TaxID=3399691 RepID=UPI003AFAFBB0
MAVIVPTAEEFHILTDDHPPREDLQHSVLEDMYALLIGSSFMALGLILFHDVGLVTGGIGGVALLISYIVPVTPGVLFTLLNLPFLVFAWRVMGKAFAIKSAIVSIGVSVMASLASTVFAFAYVKPIFAAIFGGTVIGVGILFLARHQAGVGGTGVVALWLQKTRGWNAGRTQLAFDAVVLVASLAALSPDKVLISALSAAAVAAILITFHRPGRYMGY